MWHVVTLRPWLIRLLFALICIAPTALWAQATLVIDGVVTTNRGRQAVPGAVVRLDERKAVALTDEAGRFQFKDQPGGKVTVVVVSSGYAVERFELTLEPGVPVDLEVELKKSETLDDGDVIVVEDKAEYSEPVVRKITTEEIQRIPGTFGDAVRVVQNLPGVARSPFGLGFLIVRGTEPEDTGTYVDGVRVPLIYHFGGLTAVINSDMLSRVEFLPGGYGARYGRNLGGVVDVAVTENIPLEQSGYADIDLIDTTLYYARPVGDGGGLAFSLRRSYIDAVLNPILPRILPEDSGTSIQLPVYEDYQALFNGAVGENHRLKVMVFGSRDRVALSGGGPPAEVDPLLVEGGEAGVTILNHKLLTRWTYVPNAKVTSRMTFGFGPDANRITVGAFSIELAPWSLFLREDLFIDVAPWLNIRGGFDGYGAKFTSRIELPFSLETEELDPLGEPDADSFEATAWVFSPSPYIEADLSLDKWQLTPGLRLDPYWVWDGESGENIYRAATLDPRLAFRHETTRKLFIKGNIGRFSNAPASYAIYEDLGGDPNLKPEWALQASLGAEYRFTQQISFDGSVYRGELRDLLVAPNGNEGRPTFQAIGGGINQGLEFLLRHDPGDTGFFGWISYTLQWAERTDNLANACARGFGATPEAGCTPWVPFDFDQRHILTLVASQKLKKGWEVGFRFRYTTGTPYTPVVGSFYDVDSDSYSAISGTYNSERFPAFHQLDVRVDKRFAPQWGELAVALELMNLYNRQNPEAVGYNFDYSESQFVAGIPFFPAFGVKAKF